MASASCFFYLRVVCSPDSEGALEDEASAQPGARAGQPGGSHDHELGKEAREAREHGGRRTERRGDALRMARRSAGEHGLGGENAAPHGGADAFARYVARQAGRVTDEREARPGETPRPVAADGIGVAAERRQGPQALGADARLALLRDHHVLVLVDDTEGARDRAAVAARADHHAPRERADVA